jgi:hypothetical protein
MNLDSFLGTIARRKRVCRPPVPATFDWKSAQQSVEVLANLRPSLIGAGHGLPTRDAADQLWGLAENFLLPESCSR